MCHMVNPTYLVCLECDLHSHLACDWFILVRLESRTGTTRGKWSKIDGKMQRRLSTTDRRKKHGQLNVNETMGCDHSLVPLVYSVVVYKCWLDLHCTQEAQVADCSVVDVECYCGLF